MSPISVGALYVVVPALALILAPYVLALVSTLVNVVRVIRCPVVAFRAPSCPVVALDLALAYYRTVDAFTGILGAFARAHDRFDAWLFPDYYIRLRYLALVMHR